VRNHRDRLLSSGKSERFVTRCILKLCDRLNFEMGSDPAENSRDPSVGALKGLIEGRLQFGLRYFCKRWLFEIHASATMGWGVRRT